MAAAVFACLAFAAVPAASLATAEPVEEEPLLQLDPIDSVPEARIDPSGEFGAGDSPLPEPTSSTTIDPFSGEAIDAEASKDLEGTLEELRATRARLDAQRTATQDELLRLEAIRERAEQRLDDATEAIAQRLVDLFDQGESARLHALIAVRDEGDATQRAALVAALAAADRTIIDERDGAADAASKVGALADDTRLDVLALGTRIAALDAAIDEQDGMSADERARAVGDSWSVDADLVFATGPIPGIGYWGSMAGGGALDGWMGYAAAAVGGVGCEPPNAELKATGQIEQGEASWYGPGFHGQVGANGEVYDQTKMTAAHKTLPFGTIVRVYSSATARCAFVEITDRGPYVDGRIIDLSRAAADAIGMESVAPVQVEVWAAPGGAPIA